MKVKKYRASSLKDASQKMKDELGSEAIILGTRLIEADHSVGQRKMFEITAGIEEPLVDDEEVAKHTPKLEINPGKNFYNEMKELSEKVYKGAGERKSKKDFVSADSSYKTPIKNTKDDFEFELEEVIEKLKHNEVQDELINSLVSQMKQSKGLINNGGLNDYILSNISSLVNTADFELQKGKRPQKVAFVGPTGVGKTTCIAKLATISKILHNLDVGIISIDTYRLGAIDQLRIFSEIVNIDLLIAYEPDEVPELLKKFKKKDLIFIDTAGRSQKNKEHLDDTKEFLDACETDFTYLVMSSTSTTKNLFDVASKFEMFDYDSIVFSKIDEAVVYGNILNVAARFNKPIIYLTNGQVIPDDIISAEPDFVANLIYNGKYN